MAAEWIKIEHGLIDKVEVMQLSDIFGISPYEVVGHLVSFWFWVDRNVSLECPAVPGTKSGLDRVSGRDGFADALIRVGWLRIEDGLVSIPNYDNHLSTTAKQRAGEAKKKAKQRTKLKALATGSCPDDVPVDRGQGGGPEKRREEKNTHIHMQPKVAELFQKFLDHVRLKTGQAVNDIERELLVMEVLRRGEQAADDLEFSIVKGCKTLQRASDDWQKLRADAERSKIRQPKLATVPGKSKWDDL